MTATAERKKAHRFGIVAEKYAVLYLACKGYRVLAERYRNALGEIDIVAKRGNTLAIIEVKARQDFEACAESVPLWKRQKIARATEGLLAGHGKITGLADAQEHNIRFDVIWVAPWRWPRHIKDAWRP